MAKVTIRVPSFTYEWEGDAEDEDDVWDSLMDEYEFTSLVADKAEIVTAQYDPPEEISDEDEEEEEDVAPPE